MAHVSRGFRSNYSIGGVYNNRSWDSGSNHFATVYIRFYLYVASHGIDPADSVFIGGVFNGNSAMSSGNRCASIELKNVGSQLSINAFGATRSANINISTGQWYLVEMKVAMNGVANASEIKINGGTTHTFTDSGYSDWRTIGIGCFSATSDPPGFNDCIFDLVAADSTGYIGPTP